MNEEVEALMGQMRAVTLTLTAVITAMPPDAAAEAAVNLRASLDVQREEGLGPGDASRDGIAEAYVDLLQAVARHG